MNAYEIVLKSREKGRPTAVRYISEIVENFIELHGDRRYADDRAVIGGIGTIGGSIGNVDIGRCIRRPVCQ